MWFKRKPKNRRFEREHVLDVKLRSSQVRAVRTRLVALGFSSVFLTILSVFVIWQGGRWALNRLVYQNNAFAIQEFDLQTDGVIAADQLRHWTGVKLNDNLLALDLARVKRDLELNPLIESASIERILPHTLRIRVFEREPIAQINVPRPATNGGIEIATFQVDAGGLVMSPLEPRQRATTPSQPEQFPVLGGLDANQVQPGRRLEAPQVQAALQLILAFDRSSMAGLADLKRLDVSAPDVLTATTGQGSEIVFGLTDLEQQLRRWREIYEVGQRMNKALATLDLAVTNNIPARWLEASAVPPAAPKLAKPLRLRKKQHV